MANLKITSLGSSDLRVGGKADALVAISLTIMWRNVRMAKTHLLMKITIIPGTYSMIKGMTGNAGHQGNGRLFKESKESQNLFYVPDRKKNLVSVPTMEVKGFRVALIDGKVRV